MFYVNAIRGHSLAYLTDTEPKPEGYGGSGRNLESHAALEALDYRSGNIEWKHDFPGKGIAVSGILSTAGHLVFSGDPSGNLIAWDPKNGRALWHFKLSAPVSNGPMTYLLDGKQYVIAGAGDTLFGFALNR